MEYHREGVDKFGFVNDQVFRYYDGELLNLSMAEVNKLCLVHRI